MKWTKKLTTQINMLLAIMLICFSVSFLIMSTTVLPKYYVHQKKDNLVNVYKQIKATGQPQDDRLVVENNIRIVHVPLRNQSVYEISEELRSGMQEEGLAINKLFYSKTDIRNMKNGESVFNITYQPAGKSDFFSLGFYWNGNIYVIGYFVAAFSEISSFFIGFYFIFFSVLILSVLFSVYFVLHRLIKAVTALKKQTYAISNQNYQHGVMYQPNELGELGRDIDRMSDALKQKDYILEKQNKEVQQLTADLSHELKTPISVIQASAYAVNDHIGDVDTNMQRIINESDHLIEMINNLLRMIHIKNVYTELVAINLSDKVATKMNELAQQREDLLITSRIEKDVVLEMAEIDMALFMNNLFANVFKYSESYVDITLTPDYLTLSNDMSQTIVQDEVDLWKAFTVGDASRNTTGTGIGLTTVQAILDKYGFVGEIAIEDRTFTLTIRFIA